MVKMAIVLSAITLFYSIVLTVAFNLSQMKRVVQSRASKIRSAFHSHLSNWDQVISRWDKPKGNDSHGQLTM